MKGRWPRKEAWRWRQRWYKYLIAAFVVLQVAWWVLAFMVVPRLIAAAYRGDAIELFNRMISGSDAHDLGFYLEAWAEVRALMLVFLVFVLAIGLILPVTRWSPTIPGVVAILFLTDVTLGVAYMANHLVGEPHYKLTQLLDVGGERSIPAWYSSIQFFCVSLLGALYVIRRVRWRDKLSWPLVGLPVLFLLLSIDESVEIHEWLGARTDMLLPSGDRAETFFRYTGIWMFVIGVPFLMLFFSWAYFIRRHSASAFGSGRDMTPRS